MWGKLFNYFRHLLTLAEATQRNTADQRELRQELKEITAELQQLKSELRSGLDNEKHEREKLLLRLLVTFWFILYTECADFLYIYFQLVFSGKFVNKKILNDVEKFNY